MNYIYLLISSVFFYLIAHDDLTRRTHELPAKIGIHVRIVTSTIHRYVGVYSEPSALTLFFWYFSGESTSCEDHPLILHGSCFRPSVVLLVGKFHEGKKNARKEYTSTYLSMGLLSDQDCCLLCRRACGGSTKVVYLQEINSQHSVGILLSYDGHCLLDLSR